jgi:hypothetical protein
METIMPEVIEFQRAIEATDGDDRALLIGNGFSARYFNYQSLLEKSGLDEGTPLRNMFAALSTADFEAVVRALEGAVVVETAYGNDAHAKELDDHAQKIREALVKAINTTHPKHREDVGPQYTSSAAFLEKFSTVFTLNYDLLLYWVNLEKRILKDGFGLGTPTGSFIGPFSEGAYCHLYNLHGSLHLFDNGAGEILKAVDTGSGVISTITSTIAKKHRFPIYVAEGTSVQKMRKINSVAYLRHCYETLRHSSATIFVYGHSANENDAHIYRAIFTSKAKHIYFGVYKPDDENLKALDGLLAKHQKTAGSDTAYTFFDSESAQVWGA